MTGKSDREPNSNSKLNSDANTSKDSSIASTNPTNSTSNPTRSSVSHHHNTHTQTVHRQSSNSQTTHSQTHSTTNGTSSNSNDKRQVKNRFGWVRRLMQNRQNGVPPMQQNNLGHRNQVPTFQNTPNTAKKESAKSSVNNTNNSPDTDEMSLMSNSTTDNVSTIPLKSIVSFQSTKSPSIISDPHEQSSLNTSTAETSIAPSAVQSTAQSMAQSTAHYQFLQHPPDEDNDSVVTLASSSRRIRRRSIDTNCSTTGIAPASIMERLTVHPTTANGSSYAVSIRTNERASQIDYDATDLQSSARSLDQKSVDQKSVDQKSFVRSEDSKEEGHTK